VLGDSGDANVDSIRQSFDSIRFTVVTSVGHLLIRRCGEPVMVQRKKKPSGARWKRQRKEERANAAPQADIGPGARGAHGGKQCTGTDVDTGSSSSTKRPLSPGGTSQDAQS